MKQWKIGVPHVKAVLSACEKQRMELFEEDGELLIRAAQGHSIKDVKTEDLLTEITNPFKYNEIVHGTYLEFFKLIMDSGLNKMSRNHVHFAIGYPGSDGLISGMRSSC